jgi:hypothetical protein
VPGIAAPIGPVAWANGRCTTEAAEAAEHTDMQHGRRAMMTAKSI